MPRDACCAGPRPSPTPGAVGIDQVLAASFVSPACGTGSLPLATAEACFRVAAETSAWLRERLGSGRVRRSPPATVALPGSCPCSILTA